MTIIQDLVEEQTISFIPRQYNSAETYTVKIKDEITNIIVFEDSSASFTELSYYKQYSTTFTGLKEDAMYILSVEDTDQNIIFKDKLFCTNQDIVSYTVNSDEYTEHSKNNEFIVL